MSDQLRNRKFFALVAVLFAATTWLNWTAESNTTQTHLAPASTLAQLQAR